MNISGAIGISVLKKGDTEITIFYDDHNNKEYCSDKFFINDFFEKKSNDKMVLLVEEPFFRNTDLKFIWDSSEHLKYFLNYFLKNTDKYYMFSTDIRNNLIPINIEYLENKSNITFYEYIKPLLYFFNLEDYNDLQLKQIKNIFNKLIVKNKKLILIYKILKKKVQLFANKYNKYNSIKMSDINKESTDIMVLGYPINCTNLIMMDELEIIYNTIMELFTILILFEKKSTKNNYIYMGLVHSVNIYYILVNFFGYVDIYNDGLTGKDFGKINYLRNIKDNYKSCVKNIYN